MAHFYLKFLFTPLYGLYHIEKIPDEVKKRIKYIIHIALNDRKGKYYNLLREEVLLLWELIK